MKKKSVKHILIGSTQRRWRKPPLSLEKIMKEVKHIVVCPDNVTLGLGKPEWDVVLWFAPRVVNGKMVS